MTSSPAPRAPALTPRSSKRLAGLVVFGVLSLSMCMLLATSMLLLGARFLFDLAFQQHSAWQYPMLILVVTLTGLVFLTLSLLQLLYLAYTRVTERSETQALQRWAQALSEHALFGTPLSEPLDATGAAALLELRANLRGPESRKLAELYVHSGWLARDLQQLQRARSASARAVILERLGMLAHPQAFPALSQQASGNDEHSRRLALLALARALGASDTSSQEASDWLVPHCHPQHFSTGLIRAALVLLGQAAPATLRPLLESPQRPLQLTALRVISSARHADFTPELLPLLHHHDPEVLTHALRALNATLVLPGSAVPRIRELTRHPVWFVRAQAVTTLTHAPHPPLQDLQAALGDPNWWVRRNSALALLNAGPAGQLLLDEAAQLHPDRFARDMARSTLEPTFPAIRPGQA